jgi:hypothetical protein
MPKMLKMLIKASKWPQNIKKLKMLENTSKMPKPKMTKRCSKILMNQCRYFNLSKRGKGVGHYLFFVWVSFLIFAKATS